MNIDIARENMIKRQLRPNGIVQESILEIIQATPREHFIPSAYQQLAYAEVPIPLGHEQIMLTPTEDASILQALQLKSSDKVLEVGTGSGYLTALLAKQCQQVESIDFFTEFTEYAAAKLAELALHNIELKTADALATPQSDRTYDAIVITGALPTFPEQFTARLHDGGRLFVVLGQQPTMAAMLYTKLNSGWKSQPLFTTDIPALINVLPVKGFIF